MNALKLTKRSINLYAITIFLFLIHQISKELQYKMAADVSATSILIIIFITMILILFNKEQIERTDNDNYAK